MAKQKTTDRLTRIMDGAEMAAERAIARADKAEAEIVPTREAVASAVDAAMVTIGDIEMTLKTAVANAVVDNDTWYDSHVTPLQGRLDEAKDRVKTAEAEVIEIGAAVTVLRDKYQEAAKAIGAVGEEVLAKLQTATGSITGKIGEAKAVEKTLDEALAECRKAGGSVKDALGNLQRAAGRDKKPPVCAVAESTPEALVHPIVESTVGASEASLPVEGGVPVQVISTSEAPMPEASASETPPVEEAPPTQEAVS